MTNNYFKISHFIPIGDGRLDVRTCLFFFDDTDREKTEEAFRTARTFVATIALMRLYRQFQLSIFRKLPQHPEVTEIGQFVALGTRPAA